jgi:hypothetical protein
MKFKEVLRDLRFVMKQIDPYKFAKIINKTNIIFLATKRINSMPSDIQKYKTDSTDIG